MEAIATALIAKLDVATIVLMSVVAGLGYLHIVWRRGGAVRDLTYTPELADLICERESLYG